jgi:hypothetical protein
MPIGLTGRTPRSGRGRSWFESTVGSHASVAQLAERRSRKEKATGSRQSEAPCPRSPNGRGPRSRAWVGARSSRAEGTTPPWRNWKRSGPVSQRLPVRIRPEAPVGGRGIRQTRSALTREIPGSSPGRPARFHAFVAPAVERPPGTGKAASSNLAEGSMWMWCRGSTAPCQGASAGSIPAIHSKPI